MDSPPSYLLPQNRLLFRRENSLKVWKKTSTQCPLMEKATVRKKKSRNEGLVLEGAFNSREYRQTDSPRVSTPVVLYSAQEFDGNDSLIQNPCLFVA
jgi:hypothetical protein